MTPDDFVPPEPEPDQPPPGLGADEEMPRMEYRPRHAPSSTPATREMPASEEAEQHVIACCLLDGDETIRKALEAGITADHFYWPANQLLFQRIAALHKSPPVTLDTLAQDLKDNRLLDAVGGFAYLMQVTAKIPTTAHAGYMIAKVREKHLLREAIKLHTGAVEQCYTFSGDLDGLLSAHAEQTKALHRDLTDTDGAATALQTAQVSLTQPPPEPVTRLYLAGKPIATPGNLITITSKAKTGKTTALQAATAAIVAATTSTLDRDTFKFKAPNPNGLAVIVLDTEQSRYDTFVSYQKSLARAGNQTDHKWLHHYSLVGQTPAQLRRSLDAAIARAHRECGGVFIITLDGSADFVTSVNDEVECNAFVTWLRQRAVENECPIACVIHSNEGVQAGDDGRGHLGKQLIRKAESNLVLKKEGDITTITSDKQRKAPITEADNVAFRWDDGKQMHVSTSAPKPKKLGSNRQFHIEDYLSVFPTEHDKALTFPQALKKATAKKPISRNTFWGIVEGAARTGQIEVNRTNINEPRYWVKPVAVQMGLPSD